MLCERSYLSVICELFESYLTNAIKAVAQNALEDCAAEMSAVVEVGEYVGYAAAGEVHTVGNGGRVESAPAEQVYEDIAGIDNLVGALVREDVGGRNLGFPCDDFKSILENSAFPLLLYHYFSLPL